MNGNKILLNENKIKKDIPNNNEQKLKSKWLNLKKLLLKKKSLESTVELLKQKTINKFTSNYCEIYKYKLEMYLFSKMSNKIMFDSDYIPDFNRNILITDNSQQLCYDSWLKDFLFYFRENNSELLKIIDLLPEDKNIYFSHFLCNLFYDNFINTKDSQNEIYLILYLLLEREIKGLLSPNEEDFLNNSFVNHFLREFLYKEEIKKYIEVILISEIENINEKCYDYHTMDIIGLSRDHYKENIEVNHHYTFLNMEKQKFYENETFNDMNTDSSMFDGESFIILDKNKNDKINIETDILNNSRVISYENLIINNIIENEFFNELNINDIKKLLFKEKDEVMRSFYLKQLKKSRNYKYAFNCRDYYDKMAKEKLISKISVENYNRGYQLIIQFLKGFLNNLENKSIIPHSIKMVCKFIYLLFKKKFPKITEFQLYILVGQFLFNNLINPIFENVENININEKVLISFDTRKSLLDIALVFKKLIKGELFTNKDFGYYNIFNNFILKNYPRIKIIIQNFLNVKIPKKLLSLIEQFNNNERKPEQINYNYTKKGNIDFIIQKCICFQVDHLLLFYNIVNNNKNYFIKEGTKFEIIFNEISKYIPYMENDKKKFFVIVKEELNEDIKCLFEKEHKIKYKKSDILNKLKSHIITLFDGINIKNNWNYLNYLNTKQTFNFINKYLIGIEKRNNFFPLNWYSKYIFDNLDLIEEKYKKDDFNLLYKEIATEIFKLIIKLNDLNSVLSIYINKKIFDIEKKKNRLKGQYEAVKNNILKLKTLSFLENENIALCFMNGKKYNEIQKMINKNFEATLNNDILILNETDSCLHKKLKDEKLERLINKEELLDFHLHKIKAFAFKFASCYEFISEEIINNSISQTAENGYCESELSNDMSFINTSKGTLTTFMNYIDKLIEVSPIFKDYTKKEEREQISKFILDYILKILCIKIYELKPLLLDDVFHHKCSVLNSVVHPSNFQIPQEFLDKNVLKDIIFYLDKIEEHRTPSAMYNEIGNMINSISSIFIFFFNKKEIDFDEILNMIIYCLILTKPKRMIFTIYFCKFFLMKGDITGSLAFNISQIESAIKFINKINAIFLNMSDKEFNEKISQFEF